MSKLEENKKKKRDALLKTAFDLFTEKGIQKTSIADIVERAGVGKGTFYLYFKDKYDIHNKLISHKASLILNHALRAVEKKQITEFEEQIICMADDILMQLQHNKILLSFINKNLSWAILKNAVSTSYITENLNAYDIYERMLEASGKQFKNPEIMIYMIIELVGSTCYSTILYEDPVSVDEIKPYLFDTIRQIIKSQEI